MIDELKKILNENVSDKNIDFPYDRETDESLPKEQYTRKKVLKLSDIHRLRKIRNQQREELAQDAVFIPVLFGPDTTNPQDGGMPIV